MEKLAPGLFELDTSVRSGRREAERYKVTDQQFLLAGTAEAEMKVRGKAGFPSLK